MLSDVSARRNWPGVRKPVLPSSNRRKMSSAFCALVASSNGRVLGVCVCVRVRVRVCMCVFGFCAVARGRRSAAGDNAHRTGSRGEIHSIVSSRRR